MKPPTSNSLAAGSHSLWRVAHATAYGSQVLVKVGAVAVNPVDTYIRSGAISGPLPEPFVVGCDLPALWKRSP